MQVGRISLHVLLGGAAVVGVGGAAVIMIAEKNYASSSSSWFSIILLWLVHFAVIAGIVNVLHHARTSFPDVPLHAVMGGLHLSGINERIIPQTVSALAPFGLGMIAAGHCTGWRAMAALAAAFGDTVLAPLAVGKRFSF